MLQCEVCLSWCHNKCVGISPSVSESYPFVCPFCVRSQLAEISSLRLSIETLASRVSQLEVSLSDDVSQPVQLEFDPLRYH